MKYRPSLVRLADALLTRLVPILPSSLFLYHLCRRYIYRYDSEYNTDIGHNGEVRWLKSVLGECQIIFDVGANIGNWTEVALAINPKLQVHCFEPSTVTFQRLQARPFIDERVVVNHMGLSSSVGEMDLYLFGEGSGGNSVYHRSGLANNQTQVEKVHINTIDAYCTQAGIQRIDLLKLDVEGNELKVLQGASDLLAHGAIQYIQFEYGGTYIDARILLKDMFELFHAYDYHLHKIYPQKLLYVSHYEQRLENFHYQNWVAIKSTHQKDSQG